MLSVYIWKEYYITIALRVNEHVLERRALFSIAGLHAVAAGGIGEEERENTLMQCTWKHERKLRIVCVGVNVGLGHGR